jgi:excinuclease UvrABC nuclease subunit
MPRISIKELEKLPQESGIYKVIYVDLTIPSPTDIVIYVGQALNLNNRWKRHEKYPVFITDNYNPNELFIEWIEVPEWLLNCAENTAIKFYSPKYNKRMTSGI